MYISVKFVFLSGNVVRAIDLLSFIKLCCPPEKSIPNVLFKHLYTEQIESPVTVPPVSYCKRIIEGNSNNRELDFGNSIFSFST